MKEFKSLSKCELNIYPGCDRDNSLICNCDECDVILTNDGDVDTVTIMTGDPSNNYYKELDKSAKEFSEIVCELLEHASEDKILKVVTALNFSKF